MNESSIYFNYEIKYIADYSPIFLPYMVVNFIGIVLGTIGLYLHFN